MQTSHDGGTTGTAGTGEKQGFFSRCRTRFTAVLRAHAGRDLLPPLAMFLVGLCFARTPVFFGAFPLALALLCGARRGTIPVFVGALAGAATLGISGAVYAVVYLVALLIRLLFSLPGLRLHALPDSHEVFCEYPQMQVVAAAVTSVATAVYELSVSGFTSGAICFSLATVFGSVLLAPVFSWLFSYGITLDDVLGRPAARAVPHGRWEKLRMQGALLLLLFLFSYSLKDLSLFGVNFSYFFTAAAALFISRRFGALRGCVVGLIVGFGGSAIYAPAFGLVGLCAGILWPLGAVYSMLIGAAAGIGWCSYVGGLSGFLGVGPEIAVATLLSMPILPRLYSDAIAGEVKEARGAAEEAVREAVEREGNENRIARLADAFGGLAKTCSERPLAPDENKCFRLCDEICTKHCDTCPSRVSCWDSEERPGERALRILAGRMARGESLTPEDLPTTLLTDCPHLGDLIGEMRLEGARLWQTQRRAVGADYPSPDYALTAELLREASDAEGEATRVDMMLSSKIRRLLSDMGIRPAAVSVTGGRMRKIVIGAADLAGRQREAASLTEKLEELVGCRLSTPRFESAEGVVTMSCHTVPRYALEVSYVTRAARGGDVSGDAVGVFGSPDGYSYLLLSDGMGTGRGAARTAGVCTLFLEKMLSAGNSKETSLKMLNHLVSLREDESSATVDLLEFDTCYGHASFVKSGAAASYVRREGNLFRLRSRTIPIGLVREVDAEKLRFDTQPGDIIIMLSDGVSQTTEDAPWLVEMLSKPMGASLEAAANAILERALAEGAADDLTVIIAKVTTV